MGDSDDLAAFLEARLDDEEAAAKAAVHSGQRAKCSSWTARRDGNGYVIGDDDGHFAFCLVSGEGVMQHVTRHDPASVLRDVEAKRGILAALKRTEAGEVTSWHPAATSGQIQALNWTVRVFAEVHSSHPDYLPEWKP